MCRSLRLLDSRTPSRLILANDINLNEAVLVHASRRLDKSVFDSGFVDFLVGQERQLPCGTDIVPAVGIPLCEDDVNLLQRAATRLRVQEVDDGQEAGVYDGEEEVGAPSAVEGTRSVGLGRLHVLTIRTYMFVIMMGVIITIKKLKSQLVHVETALALARVLMGLISAG